MKSLGIKGLVTLATLVLACAPLCSCGAAKSDAQKAPLDADFARFTKEKEALTKSLVKKYGLAVRPVVWEFFTAVHNNDWIASSNRFNTIMAHSGRFEGNRGVLMPTQIWPPVHETFGAYEQFATWNPTLIRKFGATIIHSIPSNSIYFGGTDAGRFVISALSHSHQEGRPFFILTQNALADTDYLDYLHEIYGTRIYIPTTNDTDRAFKEYLDDAQVRLKQNKLKEGEHFKIIENRVQVSGQTAVMLINERLVKVMIDKNPERQIYIEESYPLESLYPHSVPHGIIIKLSHSPIEQLSKSAIEMDHTSWNEQIASLVGKVVGETTTVKELCSRAENIYVRSNLTDFSGDISYLRDAQAPQYFSKCRSAIASLYQWRSARAQDKEEAGMLSKEADFAHRQAIALSPYNVEVVQRYVTYLLANQRTNDARTLIHTTLKIEPEKRMSLDSEVLRNSMTELRKKAGELGIGVATETLKTP